jgi:hypothetical protein
VTGISTDYTVQNYDGETLLDFMLFNDINI